MLLALLLACSDKGDTAVAPEPLDLPADPAAPGVPVGIRTVSYADQTLEVWYPAPDAVKGEAEDTIDFTTFVPDSVLDTLVGLTLPTLGSGGVRDADLRPPEAPYPVLLFSHGFGGMRVQSMDYASHLASRGYVVVAPDHPGRMLGDVLPCLFKPALEGCDLSGFVSDPAPEDLSAALAWVDEAAAEGDFAGALDTSAIGLSGHSAGAASTATVGADEDRTKALLMMAGGDAVDRDVPVAVLGGTCDGFADPDGLAEAAAGTDGAQLGLITGAGHLAFADLCDLDLGGLAETWLLGRDDLNEAYIDGLLALGTDGCPGATPTAADCTSFLDLETSAPIVRHVSTAFFDTALRGQDTALGSDAYPALVVE